MNVRAIPLLKDKIVFLIIFLLVICSFFFPYKIVETVGGVHATIFGSSNYVNPSRKIFSGFDIPFCYLTLLFVGLIACLLVFYKNRAVKIIALVITFMYVLYLFILYFGLTFSLNLFGPQTITKAGIGYYILLMLSVLFIIQVILTFIKSYNGSNKKELEVDLLDDYLI